jgi:hypothetical protein
LPDSGLPHHEWFIAFERPPADPEGFRLYLDESLRSLNAYYDDLISGSILQTLVITPIQTDAFIEFMKGQGKLGGQNKVPRLSNDRKIADELSRFKL